MTTKSRRSIPPFARMVAKFLVTAGILVWVGWHVSWSEMGHHFRGARFSWITAAAAIMGLNLGVNALRWRTLAMVQDITLPVGEAVRLTFLGQFFNSFLIGSTGGDAVRAIYLARLSPRGWSPALISILMDRALGLIGLLLFATVFCVSALPMLALSPELRRLPYVVMSILVVVLGCLLAIVLLPMERARFAEGWKNRRGRLLQYFVLLHDATRAYARRPLATLTATLLALVPPVLLITAGLALANALSLPLTPLAGAIIIPIVMVAISVPITVSGFGVREGAFSFLFAGLGVTHPTAGPEAAIAFSVLWYALGLFWSLLGGVAFILNKDKPSSAAPVPAAD